MPFRLLTSQFPIGLNDGLHGIPQALPGLFLRPFLHVATGQFLDVSDPPLTNALEHGRVTVLHGHIVAPPDQASSRGHACTHQIHGRTTPDVLQIGGRRGGMAYDEKAAARVRKALARKGDLVEKKMFGGVCFMLNDHMCLGLTGDTLMVRVGLEAFQEALAQPHARPMDFTGRPMKGFVFVDPPGYETDAALAGWARRGAAYVASAPPKSRKRPRPRGRPRVRGSARAGSKGGVRRGRR
jgi:hypothetical protein